MVIRNFYHRRIARPSSAGLRAAYSEGNLSGDDMYGARVENMRGLGGSVPWLADNRSTKLNAAQNRYLHTNSSIFGDGGHREAIRQQRTKLAMQDLQQQTLAREEFKRLEREEEARIDAAMAVPDAYDPSFQDPAATRRDQGHGAVAVQDTAASVNDTGGRYGGGYDGYDSYNSDPYGDGGYGGGGGYDDGGGYGGGYDQGGGGYSEPTNPFLGLPARAIKPHVSMTSEEREALNAARANYTRQEQQWQLEMKRQLDEEKKKKRQLEDRLYEESIRKQQERMQQEYEAELEKKRRKEEEQTRRREAQLKQMEAMQKQAEEERKARVDHARRLADLKEPTPTPKIDTGLDARVIRPAKDRRAENPEAKYRETKTRETKTRETTDRETKDQETKDPEPPKRNPKNDDEFGFNLLKSDSTFLAAQKPNKFFEKNEWEQKKPPRQEPHQPVVKGTPFDWKIRIQEATEDDRKKFQNMSQEEIQQFQSKNQDVMSQLTAMKTNLRSASGARQPGQGQGGGGYVPSGPGSHHRLGTADLQLPTIPAGNTNNVDYMRIRTPAPDPRQQPQPYTQQPKNDFDFNPNESSGTMIRKFMEKNRQYRN